METGAREPPRDQGKGEARPAGRDGGGEPERLQVSAVPHLRGLEGSVGGGHQLLPAKGARGGRGCQARGREEGRAPFKSHLQGRNPPFSAAGLGGGSSPHPGPQLRVSAPALRGRPGPLERGAPQVGRWALGVREPGERGWRDEGAEGLRRNGGPVRAASSICLTHEDPHLLLAEDPRKQRGHREAHGGARGRGRGRGHGRGVRAGTGRPRGDGAQQQKGEVPPPPPRVRAARRHAAPPLGARPGPPPLGRPV